MENDSNSPQQPGGQPTSPSPAPPPLKPTTITEQNRYDFIMNPNNPQMRPLIPDTGSKKKRIIIVAVGAILLVIVAMIVMSLLSNAGKADTQALISAAKQQQELIRVSEIGVQKSKTQQAKNLAVTTKLALSSEQAAMQGAIKTAGMNPKKVLQGSRNTKTDQRLTTADQNNRFDDEFIIVMNESLTAYQKSVKAAYDGATSKKLRDALKTQYQSANALAGVKQTE